MSKCGIHLEYIICIWHILKLLSMTSSSTFPNYFFLNSIKIMEQIFNIRSLSKKFPRWGTITTFILTSARRLYWRCKVNITKRCSRVYMNHSSEIIDFEINGMVNFDFTMKTFQFEMKYSFMSSIFWHKWYLSTISYYDIK